MNNLYFINQNFKIIYLKYIILIYLIKKIY